jgi:hypothetical protein
MNNEEIFIRNKQRGVKPDMGSPEDYQPEYERLDKQPNPVSVSEDFNYAKQRPLVVGSKTKARPGDVVENLRKRKVMIVADEAPESAPPQPKRVGTVSGYSHERTWETNQQRPRDVLDDEAVMGDIHYDDVPDVPPQQKAYSYDDVERSLKSLPEGTIALVVGDEMIECASVEEAEGIVEALLFNDSTVNIHDISVFHKLTVRIGVSVK